MQAEAMKKAEESERVRKLYMTRNAELDSREAELVECEKLLNEREKSLQAAYSEKIAEADKLKNMFKESGFSALNFTDRNQECEAPGRSDREKYGAQE